MRRLASCVLAIVSVAGCGTLAHPSNNDGADSGNPTGINSGATPTLTLEADSAAIAVGSGSVIRVYYNGQPFPFGTSLLTMTSSDSTVVGCCAYGSSVGSATLTYTYANLQASVDMAVHQNSNGAWARLGAVTRATGSFWVPDSVHVPVGSLVEFSLFAEGKHNVAFDSIPGAPADIPTPTQTVPPVIVARTFSTAGRFPFRCTLHGETGVVIVTP